MLSYFWWPQPSQNPFFSLSFKAVLGVVISQEGYFLASKNA